MGYEIQKICVDKEPLTYINATGITGLIDKPFLKQWAVDLAVDYIKTNKNILNDDINDRGSIVCFNKDWKNVLEQARYAHKNYLNKTADVGSTLHNIIETYINIRLAKQYIFSDLPKDANLEDLEDHIDTRKEIEFIRYIDKQPYNIKQMFYQFYIWQRENVKEFIESEKPVVHQDLCYAGTLDFIYRGFDDKIYCIDVKTSGSVYKEHEIQAVSYKYARESMEGDYIVYNKRYNNDWTKTYNYPKIKIDASGILNIQRDYFWLDFKVTKDSDIVNYMTSFEGLLTFFYSSSARKLKNKRAKLRR